MPSPICLFTYNRLSETKQTVEALQENYLASGSDLIVFSDGAKTEAASAKVAEVRKFIQTIKGFKSLEIIESPENKGLAKSIISGVSSVIQRSGKVIVLEDDLITSPNFLDFMNQALDFYANQEKAFSVSGYTMDLPSLTDYSKDFYLGYRASSWGWATWADRWNKVDWEVNEYNRFIRNPVEHFQFMRGGSDLPYMLWKQMNGKIDSWAIRWCFDQYKKNLFTVFPKESKIKNIGFGETATHTKSMNQFDAHFGDETKREFLFDDNLIVNKVVAKEFRKRFSVLNRIKNKLTA
ncbi:glycosyltransferase [Maribellus comscasis]|uniref:Glycosyltransferase n=2 Tax=Maribellus comscasis TaxID=2681766 RepID=A0A6I6K5Z4_9BACT|nr:glycosyltransferase [Maribellus comscasis]